MCVCVVCVVCVCCVCVSYPLSLIQVLLTKSDLNDPQSRELLKETVQDLLAMNVIPVLNANDTVSEPYAPDEGNYVSITCVDTWSRKRGREGGREREREENGGNEEAVYVCALTIYICVQFF